MKALIFSLLIFGFYQSVSALCVNTNGANLRAGPGKSHPVTWRVNKYMPLVDLDYKRGWYKVQDLDGQTHWIYKATVSKSLQCMAVKVSRASLRTGPGLDKPYADLPSVGRYYAFKRIGFDPPWYRVEDDQRGRYWVHENLLWLPLKRHNINF